MILLRALLPSCLLMLGCVGEAVEAEEDDHERDDVASANADIIAGSETFDHPEIGMLRSATSYCTATLIRSNVVLTAAHCIAGGWKDQPIEGYSFDVKPSSGVSKRFMIDRAYTLPVAADFAPKLGQSWRRKDIALMRLTTSVPSDLAKPRALASARPMHNALISVVGYGCTSWVADASGHRPGGGIKRKASFPWDSTNIGSGASQRVCAGDSGGPWVDVRSGKVFGTTSGVVNGDDRFGDIPGNAAEINRVVGRWTAL